MTAGCSLSPLRRDFFDREPVVCSGLAVVSSRAAATATASASGFDRRTGRGREARTPDLRIWNPLLYQLSYTPNVDLRGALARALASRVDAALLTFDVERVLLARACRTS